MPKKRIKKDYAPHIDEGKAPLCEVKGCKQDGIYKAPKSKRELNIYHWFCLEHIREHNAKWDFFDGMSRSEIEAFMKDAVTGHRPTWDRNMTPKMQFEQLQAALEEFLGMPSQKPRLVKPVLPLKIRNALSVMDMEHPFTRGSLKTQYRRLVKKYHPDTNKGDKKAEDTFKKVATSYAVLVQYLENEE